MMQPERYFENFFADRRIIPSRLLNFAKDCLQRLIAQNGSNAYDALIALLTPLITALEDELGEVDVALGLQKGATFTVDQFEALFKSTMSAKKGVIADLLGGENTAVFLEFYPHGGTEYADATRTNMSVLTNRVYEAATAHAGELGAPLTTQLQAFKTAWNNTRDDQVEKIGVVGDQRTDRSEARRALETGLLKTVHQIADKFPGNVEECLSFFSFHLLLPVSRRSVEILEGTIPAGQKVVVLNRTLFSDMLLRIKNTDGNARFVIYLAATPDADPIAIGKEIKPGRTKTFKPQHLGDINGTYLIILNLNTTNDGSYRIEIKA